MLETEMRKFLAVFFLALTTVLPLRADDVAVSSQASGSCQDSGCASTSTVKPAWQTELDDTNKSWDACRHDVDMYCEGIQVGSQRLVDCLKDHLSQISAPCRQAQGL